MSASPLWPIGSTKIVRVIQVFAGISPERPLATVVEDPSDGAPMLLRLVTHAIAPEVDQEVVIRYTPDEEEPHNPVWTIIALSTFKPTC